MSVILLLKEQVWIAEPHVHRVDGSVSRAPCLTPARPAEASRRTRKVRRGAARERGTSAPTGA